jgi:Sel1 repeat
VASDQQRRAKSLFGVAVAGPLEDGNNTYQRGDYAAAMRLLRPRALQGDADAQFKVGVMYDQGWGVPRNYTLALAWFREAAQQGVAGAQFNVGVKYAAGRGVARDEAEAALWYYEAAEQGNVAARNNLGAMPQPGQGVPQDDAQALAWIGKPPTEQGVGRLKRFKRVALRCEKTARNFRSIVSFAAGLCLIKFVHTAYRQNQTDESGAPSAISRSSAACGGSKRVILSISVPFRIRTARSN